MNLLKKSSLILSLLAACGIPAMASVTVNSPTNGENVGLQFTLSAVATTCSNQPVSAMGFSLDSSTDTTIVKSTSIDATVSATAGKHTLHVKAWGDSGAVCVTDVAITASSSATSSPAPATTTTTSSASGAAVSKPLNNSTVSSPFVLDATATDCSSQPVSSLGYSLDNSTSTTIVKSTSVAASVSASAGAHTLHVKAWGDKGAVCVTNVAITVSSSSSSTSGSGSGSSSSGSSGSTGSSSSASSVVPSDATSVSSIQSLSNWEDNHDPGTSGSASGSMSMAGSPSLSGHARQFNSSFSGSGGEIYHVTWGDDTSATNFFYDGWVYFTSSASSIGNLEMDMNQVTSNGQTVIYGFQCDGYSGTWDYTENAGSPTSPSDKWVHSKQACNPRNWSRNAWHHVQIYYSRSGGNVTYHSVWLDGAEAPIDATVPSSFALGWGPVLLTNFQVDGLGSGSNTVYLDNFTISRW